MIVNEAIISRIDKSLLKNSRLSTFVSPKRISQAALPLPNTRPPINPIVVSPIHANN